MFVHLRGHSTYSLLESIGSISDILKKIKEFGMSSVALTEYYFSSGMIEFYQKAQKENIKPILGIELGFVSDIKFLFKERYVGNITLLVKNKQGYYNLLKLLTEANKYKKDDKPCIDFNILKKYTQGLFILLGGVKSFFGQMIIKKEDKDFLYLMLDKLISIIGNENLLLDIIVQDYNLLPDLKNINEEIENISKIKGLTLLINNNFHYINKEDKKYFETALAIKDGKKMYDEDRRKVIGDFHIMNEDEIFNTMIRNGFKKEFISKLINNNLKIADSINIDIDLHQKLFPVYQTPKNIKEIYDKCKNNLIEK